jgi:hypothetical protein
MFITGCEISNNEDIKESTMSFNKQSIRAVIDHYSNIIIEKDVDLSRTINIFNEIDNGNDRLILGSYYMGMGQENCELFYIEEENGQAIIRGIATGQEPLSMGYSVNKVFIDDITVLFGTFSDTNFDVENDIMVDADYTDIEVIFSDGLTVNKNIKDQDGYIVIGATTSKIKNIILYEDNEVSVELENLLEYDEVVNEVEFFKE